jgi:predicted RNase H-like nuclease (RuvC/YqgF family)
MSIVKVGQNTETREQLLDRATKQRVQIASMRADMIKLELYREKVDGLEEQNRLLNKENNRLASNVGKLNKKIEKLTGKVEKKAVKSAEQDSKTVEPDDRRDDTAGAGGCGVSD